MRNSSLMEIYSLEGQKQFFVFVCLWHRSVLDVITKNVLDCMRALSTLSV